MPVIVATYYNSAKWSPRMQQIPRWFSINRILKLNTRCWAGGNNGFYNPNYKWFSGLYRNKYLLNYDLAWELLYISPVSAAG